MRYFKFILIIIILSSFQPIKAENKDKKLEFNFTQRYLDNLVQIIQRQDADSVNRELSNLHPSDSAEIISNLPDQRREDLFKIVDFTIDAKIMIELTDELQREILSILDITSPFFAACKLRIS